MCVSICRAASTQFVNGTSGRAGVGLRLPRRLRLRGLRLLADERHEVGEGVVAAAAAAVLVVLGQRRRAVRPPAVRRRRRRRGRRGADDRAVVGGGVGQGRVLVRKT